VNLIYLIFRSYCAEITPYEKLEGQIKNCLKQNKFKQYSAAKIIRSELGTDDTEDILNDSMNIQILLKYASNKKNVYEEVLMFDETSLVGSMGGSLGLFVGFSFFGYAIPIVEVIYDKIADFLVK
jgi:hypothetical protein